MWIHSDTPEESMDPYSDDEMVTCDSWPQERGNGFFAAAVPQISNSSVMDLPEEVIQVILAKLSQTDLSELSLVNRFFHARATKKLYNKIVIINDEVEADFLEQCKSSYLKISKLEGFTQHLSPTTFLKMNKLIIHSQSNLIGFDYFPLYQKLFQLWDFAPHHKIAFMNFDINNIRNYQTINQYVSNRSTHFVEDELMNLHQNSKVNNLKNWMVFDFRELLELPYNRNLEDLDIFIEQSISSSPLPTLVPNALLQNLETVKGLYLNSPISSSQFLEYFKDLSHPIMRNLEKLSITSSHSYKDNSRLSFAALSKVIDFNTIKKFEVKMNCVHHDCNCINQFFNDVPKNHLQKFILINYKSSNLKQNLMQFNDLLKNPNFFRCLGSVQSFYFNINDFIKLDMNNSPKFSFKNLISQLSHLSNMQELVIPDFFNNWLVSLPSIFERPSIFGGEIPEPENYFDLLLNKCFCQRCNETRLRFKKLSNFDSKNNFKHEFKRHVPSSTSLFESNFNSASLIEFNTSNVSFLKYLIANLKRQFIYINENLFSINSVINSNEKPFIQNTDLIPYNQLFLHNCLNHLVARLKYNRPELKSINLGGVLVEFDVNNHVKAPYNV